MSEAKTDVRTGPVFGLNGEGTGFLDQWRQALINMNAILRAQGATPPELETVSVDLRDMADWNRDPMRRDLLFREVMGGNIPEFIVSETAGFEMPEALVAVNGHARLGCGDPDEIVYKDFSRTDLNREYSARAAVPEHLSIFQDWHRRGLAFQARRSAEIAYGGTPFETIDLYLPEEMGAGRPPLNIFIHGGYWQAMDKLDHGFLMETLLDRGAAVALLNYSLCPEVRIEDIVGQCRRALAVLCRQAGDWGYDPARIHVSGHSAGGHLGAMMAATAWPDLDSDLPRDLVKSATLVSGLYDLEPLRFTGMNRALGLTEEAVVLNNAVNKEPAHTLPVILAVGGNESSEFHRQSALLHQAWNGKADIAWVEMPGRNHFTVIEGLTEPGADLFQAVLKIMGH